MSIIPIKRQDYQPAQSAAALAKATQTFNLFQDDPATVVEGFYLSGPCRRIVGVSMLFEAALAAAETLAVTLLKVDKDTGALTTLMTALALTNANTVPGTTDYSVNLLPAASDVNPGDVIRLAFTYVAGGGPAAPHVNFAVQAGL